MPSPGEAGCDVGCVRQLTSYLAAIHRWVRAFAAPVSTGQPSGSRPDPYVGGATYCAIPDPTDTGGCITAATAWLLRQLHDRPARRLPPPSRRRPRLGPDRVASRTAAYELIRVVEWPTPVFRLGKLIRIPTAPMLELLGIPPASRARPAEGDAPTHRSAG